MFFNSRWLHAVRVKWWLSNDVSVNIRTEIFLNWNYDPRSYKQNSCDCVKKPEKFRASTGFEPVTSRYRCDALTNWAMKPLNVGSWSFVGSNVPVRNESTLKWYMKCILYELRIWNQVKLWSSQLWTQFLRLRKEAWKIKDFNGVWTRDLAIPVQRSNQLSYEATDVGRREDHSFTWFHIRSSYMMHFIYHFSVDSFLTGTIEPTNDQLTTSVTS